MSCSARSNSSRRSGGHFAPHVEVAPELVPAQMRGLEADEREVPRLAAQQRLGEACDLAGVADLLVADREQIVDRREDVVLAALMRLLELAAQPLEQPVGRGARRGQQVAVAPAVDLDAVERLGLMGQRDVERDRTRAVLAEPAPERRQRQVRQARADMAHPLRLPHDRMIQPGLGRQPAGVETRAKWSRPASPRSSAAACRPRLGAGSAASAASRPRSSARAVAARPHPGRSAGPGSYLLTPVCGRRDGPAARIEAHLSSCAQARPAGVRPAPAPPHRAGPGAGRGEGSACKGRAARPCRIPARVGRSRQGGANLRR